MNDSFAVALQKALDATTLTEVKKYGYCHYCDEFTTNYGYRIKISVYELDGKTYIIKYVDSECTMFKDITPLPQI